MSEDRNAIPGDSATAGSRPCEMPRMSSDLVHKPLGNLAKFSVAELVYSGIALLQRAKTFTEIKEIRDRAEALRVYQRSIGAAQDAQNACAEIRVRAERRMGEELQLAGIGKGRPEKSRAGRDLSGEPAGTPKLSEIGVTFDQSSRYQHLAGIPEETFEAVIEAHKEVDEPLSAASVGRVAEELKDVPEEERVALVKEGVTAILSGAKGIRTEAATAKRATNEALKAATPAPVISGKYGTIVIDPPWDMQKIQRDVRPNQVDFEYPAMSEEELAGFPVPDMAGEDCHLFLWTTQRFLPIALRLCEPWGFRYVLTMVWHKPGGFQPIGLPQYNCEFVIYARRGSPKFVDTKAFPCVFQAQRREHSRKPDEFYDLIRRVTADGRIDVFSREPRDGFAQFGNETSKFGDAA